MIWGSEHKQRSPRNSFILCAVSVATVCIFHAVTVRYLPLYRDKTFDNGLSRAWAGKAPICNSGEKYLRHFNYLIYSRLILR